MLEGFLIGNYTNNETKTGVTVLLAPQGAVGGVSVRGGAPATHETDLFRAENTVDKVNAVVLSGGSAFGLEAISGVARFLHEKGCGYDAGGYRVPICAGASIYDLEYGSFDFPNKEAGYFACQNAAPIFEMKGSIGAGAGATVCKMGGMSGAKKSGMAVCVAVKGSVEMAVVTVVNALGDIYDPATGKPIKKSDVSDASPSFSNTTITCVLTNASLTKAQANKLADVTQDAYAKCIRPVHTAFDGDSIFVLSSASVAANPVELQMMADALCSEAILRAVTSND